MESLVIERTWGANGIDGSKNCRTGFAEPFYLAAILASTAETRTKTPTLKAPTAGLPAS